MFQDVESLFVIRIKEVCFYKESHSSMHMSVIAVPQSKVLDSRATITAPLKFDQSIVLVAFILRWCTSVISFANYAWIKSDTSRHRLHLKNRSLFVIAV